MNNLHLELVCANCEVLIDYNDNTRYNEREDVYYCDLQCYDEWAADNVEKVARYYAEMNVVK